MCKLISICSLLCCGIAFSADLPEKIKSIWHYGGDSPVYKKFADVGLNSGSFQFFPLKNMPKGGINQAELARWRITVKLAKANHIVPFAKLYIFGDWVAKLLKHRSYQHVVTETGQRSGLTPCPLERKFWIDIWQPVFVQVAKVLKEENCAGGVLLENESYSFGSIYPGFWDLRKRYCFCDNCFGKFLKSRNIRLAELPAKKNRTRWLGRMGLACEYNKFMENEFANIIAEMTNRARRVWPEFYIAQYPYFSQWFCDGIIRGGSDTSHPCLLFSHIEYFRGYYDFSSQRQSYLAYRDFNIRYLGGLTIGYYKPMSLAEKMAELLQRADGYWLYWGGTLTSSDWKNRLPGGKDFKKLSHEYRLLAPPKDYWQAIGLANRGKVSLPVKDENSRMKSVRTIFEQKTPVVFGPDDGSFGGRWYIESKIDVPEKSWLKLSATFYIKGKQKFTRIGFGKLNWYDWNLLHPGSKVQNLERVIKLSENPSLLVSDERAGKKSITVRFHVYPTENTVTLSSLKVGLMGR